MGFKITRKPFRIGASQAITLPHGWCAFYGDRIHTLTILGNTLLVIAPEGLEDQAAKIVEEMEQKLNENRSGNVPVLRLD